MSYERFCEKVLTRMESPAGFNHTLDSWSLSDWITAIVGELGEAANAVKKLNRIRDGMPNRKGETEEELMLVVKEELADTFTYLVHTAKRAGFDLLEAAEEKYAKLNAEIGYEEPYEPFDNPDDQPEV